MASISFQSLLSTVTSEFSVRRNIASDPKKFTQTILQISDQQSRDKDYEKGLQYIRTYIGSLQSKLNTIVEELNNAYETMLNETLYQRADTNNTAKLLNRIPNADMDTCAAASIGDANALDITPYSKNIYNYQYNPLFASKALDMSNYSDLGANNDTSVARGYYETANGLHHELGASVFGTLSYLWMWDVDRINATYATTMSEFTDAGGILHVPPGDKRIGKPGVIEDASIAFAGNTLNQNLQVNVTALQPNRGVFKPESEELHQTKKTLLTLNAEPTEDNPEPLAGWITNYDHSGSSGANSSTGVVRGPGLGAEWEGLNQWGVDTSTHLNGSGSLHFGNIRGYETHELDLANGGFKVDDTYATHAGYLFDPELVREDFTGETAASLQAQGWSIGDTSQVSVTGASASGQPGDAIGGGAVLNVHYSGGINGPGGDETIRTPAYNLNEFTNIELSSQNYYKVIGSLHGPGCIHPSCVVQINAGGVTNTQLPNTPGSDVWTNNQFVTFNTTPPGTPNGTIDFVMDQKYADNNPNPTTWQIDDVFVKAKGWSKGEMISPAMDFTDFDNAYVDYWDKIQTDATFDKKEVYYCADYNESTKTGTWILLNTANGIDNRDWTNNKIEIPIACLTDKSNVRIKFAFDTQNSATNANLKGWNLDDIQVYGDKIEKTDFYYYRQGLDSEFVAGNGSSPTPAQDITSSVFTGWMELGQSPQIGFNSGSTVFSNSSVTNNSSTVPPVTVNMQDGGHADGVSVSASGTSFDVKVTPVASPGPYKTDGEFIVGDVITMDLSNAATATLKFNHFGEGADSSVTGNLRKIQISTDNGATWSDAPLGGSFDEQSFGLPTSTPPGVQAASVSLPVGSANTKIRFVGEAVNMDVQPTAPATTIDFWNVSNIHVDTTQGVGTPKTYKEEAVSNIMNTSGLSGAKLSFDYTTQAPANATNIKRELLVSTDGGLNYSSLGTYSGASGTVDVSLPRSNNLRYKLSTSFDVPPNTTVGTTSGLWDINNLKITLPATDGFNVKEGYTAANGDISYNINRANISFDSRESNIEGKYKLSSGAGSVPVPGRVQITNSDAPMFTNAFLSYVEQDAGVYNKAKTDTAAIWQGVTESFPSEAIYASTETRRSNYTGNYIANNVNQLMTYDAKGNQTSMYMDDALAINFGYLKKKPTFDDIQNNDSGWVNAESMGGNTVWFPYVAGTKFEEGGGYKNMSIWGKNTFVIDTSTPAGAAALAQVTPNVVAFQDNFESGLGNWTVNQLQGSSAVTWRTSTNTANSGSSSAYFGNAAGTNYALGPDAPERLDVYMDWDSSADEMDMRVDEPDGESVYFGNTTNEGVFVHDGSGADNFPLPATPGSGPWGSVWDEHYYVTTTGRQDGAPGSTAGTYNIYADGVIGAPSVNGGDVRYVVVEDAGTVRANVQTYGTVNVPAHSVTQIGTFNVAPAAKVAAEMISPPIDLSNYSSATLSFSDSFETETGFTGVFDKKDVYVSTDNGATWIQLAESGSTTSTQGWQQNSYSLPTAALNNPNVKVKFVFDSVDGRKNEFRGWNIDDLKITGTKTIPPTPATMTMTSDDDSYMYVNGFIVPPTDWVSWYNTTYKSWYTGAYTSWYNSNIKPYLAGNPALPPFNSDPYDPDRNPYDSSPPKLDFTLKVGAPTPPAAPARPVAPSLYTNVNTKNYDITPFLKAGFNTIAFKATEDHGGNGVSITGSVAGKDVSTDNQWAVKLQPTGYDGKLSGSSSNPPAPRLTAGQIVELFQTEKPDKEQLNVNFSNLDKNGIGILSQIKSIDVSVRGESTVQTYGTTTYSTKTMTDDGKMTAKLNSGYINGKIQNGGEGSATFDPTGYDVVNGVAKPSDPGLNFTTDTYGKADISLYFDKTKNIVNDATVLVKVEYYEDTNQDGKLDATELSDTNLKTKYIGMQDLRDNKAINPDSDVADTNLSGQGVLNRYAKDANGNLLYTSDALYSQQLYDNYLVAGHGRSGGANVEGNVNSVTDKLKKLLDSEEFQEILKYNLLDNIYLAASVTDNRGDQITGKLILDWDWKKRRTSITQGSFSAIYKA